MAERKKIYITHALKVLLSSPTTDHTSLLEGIQKKCELSDDSFPKSVFELIRNDF